MAPVLRTQIGPELGADPPEQFHEKFVRAVRESPFWAASLFAHVLIFLLLAAVFVEKGPTRRRPPFIPVDTPDLPVTVVIPPFRSETLTTSTSQKLWNAACRPCLENQRSELRETDETTTIQEDRFMSFRRATLPGGRMGEGPTDRELSMYSKQARDIDPGAAVDMFAIETLNSIERGSTLVVLLIDESRSIVNKDLPLVIERMNHYFKTIHLNVRPQYAARGRWVVFSYGKNVTLRGAPTGDLEKVKKALAAVTADPSGEENVLAAVNKALDLYGGKQKFMLIAALTDERGSDAANEALLEKTIKDMDRYDARFFVFGREAVFGNSHKTMTVTFAGKKHTSVGDGGPESPLDELWRGHSLWGVDSRDIPSGFGMYALNRMTHVTEGIYFLLEPESKYDERRLYGLYAPDLCSRTAYLHLMDKDPLRKIAAQSWRAMDQMGLPGAFRSPKEFAKAIGAAEGYRTWCEKQATLVESVLRGSRMNRGAGTMRWRAHAQVTHAELLRRAYALNQYILCLREDGRKIESVPDKHYIVVHWSGKQRGGRSAVSEFEGVKQAMERVFQEHRDTPWEVLVRRMAGQVRVGLELKVAPIPKPGTDRPDVPPV